MAPLLTAREVNVETVQRPAVYDKFVLILGGLQLVMLVLYGVGVKYDDALFQPAASDNLPLYPNYQDVHVMIFIGFGFLMTFLRKYMLSAVTVTMLVAAVAIEWHMLCHGFLAQVFAGTPITYIRLDLVQLVLGDFAAAAVLVSCGACLGKITPTQMIVFAVLEILFFNINEQICLSFGLADVGGSIVVHVFGAYFGLAASWVLTSPEAMSHSAQGSEYHSDTFSLIGTLFLWLFWPSFNGALAGVTQQRVIINSVLALIGSAVGTFLMSYIKHGGKFSMEELQNATLAGGVAIGTSANFAVQPAGALSVGLASGFLSVIGFENIQPWLLKKLKVHDTCGVHNLHGMPGVLAAIVSAVYALFSTAPVYKCADGAITSPGCQVTAVFGSRSSEFSPGDQALAQIYSLLVTLAISTVTGVMVAYLVKYLEPRMDSDLLFRDKTNFDLDYSERVEVTAQPARAKETPSPNSESQGASLLRNQGRSDGSAGSNSSPVVPILSWVEGQNP
mmetsp:Transcript_15305/g.39389  ORF Transcript_15305/g.39389 Transcript_15305/m.39389 type:complete len:505 (-) Transcript_15305:39-1553(-)